MMFGLISRIALAVGLAVIVAILGAAAVEGKGPKSGAVLWVGDCIDFDQGIICGPAEDVSESALLDEQIGANTCQDGIDNDADGRVDKRDSQCHMTCQDYATGLTCSDRDHDGWLRYVEVHYGSDPDSAVSTPEAPAVPGTCEDGVDNDADGQIDECGGLEDCIDFSGDTDCAPF